MNKGMMPDRELPTRRFCLDQKGILLQGKQLKIERSFCEPDERDGDHRQ